MSLFYNLMSEKASLPLVHFFFKTFFGAFHQFLVSNEVENHCFEVIFKNPLGF